MKGFKNKGKIAFLESIPKASIENENDLLSIKCKFNFAYFTVQPAGQAFVDWTHPQLVKLLNSLKDFSEFSLHHWRNETIGQSGTVLAIYGAFPENSDFKLPLHIPHQAQWGRFRLTSAVRLVGFVLPDDFHKRSHFKTNENFDCNTFYVVFLDANHAFWKGKENK